MHLDIGQQNLDRYEKRDAFLDRIITGDETWVHHYELECKWHSIEWKHPQLPITKKVKSQPTARKLMLTVFWDSQGPILEHYQEKGSTINSAHYSEMLIGRLKSEIRSIRQGQLSKRIVLVHDNACPHTAAHIVETPPETHV
jgi:hypothetical protein